MCHAGLIIWAGYSASSGLWWFSHLPLSACHPPTFQQIRQLRIKDRDQKVSHLSQTAIPKYSCLWDCKAAPAVALTAGSRHSPLLPGILCKPSRWIRSSYFRGKTKLLPGDAQLSSSHYLIISSLSFPTAKQPGTTHTKPWSSPGPQWSKSSQTPLHHTQKGKAARLLRPCWKKRLK